MRQLYQTAEYSRQAHHQWQQHSERQRIDRSKVIDMIRELRKEHPKMGLRKLHDLYLDKPLQPAIGRDRFIAIGTKAGLQLQRPVNRARTTIPVKSIYPNLLVGRTLTDVNQVWVSDITYYRIGEVFSYITLIMDLYSRRIVAACAGTTLEAHWSASALQNALIERQITNETGLIHHSDKGSQYLSKEYLAKLATHEVQVSTCQIVYENAHAERLNGTIKLEYLDAWVIDSHARLVALLKVAVDRYNRSRPHGSLHRKSPDTFERALCSMPLDEHLSMPIWPKQPLVNLTENVSVPYIVR